MATNGKAVACILGGTGAFGLATAEHLASRGYDLVLVYRERKASLADFAAQFRAMEDQCRVWHFNLNANEPEKRQSVVESLVAEGLSGRITFLLHALADGNLRPAFPAQEAGPGLEEEDFIHTIRAMGTSLQQWTRALLDAGLFAAKASVAGLSSEGSTRYFKDYAAVAAAKSVMETMVRYMAVELAPRGIRANIVHAGITDTNALKVFPSYDHFLESARRRNPAGRLTRPEDVAPVLAFLASADAAWINGTHITVDGGEHLIGLT